MEARFTVSSPARSFVRSFVPVVLAQVKPRVQKLTALSRQNESHANINRINAKPLRMLPLSVWSWQNTVKAVLSGKAVVVDIYPDVYVRAVNLDMPVPRCVSSQDH